MHTSSIPVTAPGTQVGITELTIHTVVHQFYAHIRVDPFLGPIFNRIIADNWDAHLARMCDFWSSVLLMTGRFKGAPMQVHAAIAELERAHFERWLALFRQTLAETGIEDGAAELFLRKAEQIGESLLFGISAFRARVTRRPQVAQD